MTKKPTVRTETTKLLKEMFKPLGFKKKRVNGHPLSFVKYDDVWFVTYSATIYSSYSIQFGIPDVMHLQTEYILKYIIDSVGMRFKRGSTYSLVADKRLKRTFNPSPDYWIDDMVALYEQVIKESYMPVINRYMDLRHLYEQMIAQFCKNDGDLRLNSYTLYRIMILAKLFDDDTSWKNSFDLFLEVTTPRIDKYPINQRYIDEANRVREFYLSLSKEDMLNMDYSDQHQVYFK